MIVKIRVKVRQYNQYHIHNTLNLNISILKINKMLLPITFTIQNVYLRRQVNNTMTMYYTVPNNESYKNDVE